jgi:hypothetical protein
MAPLLSMLVQKSNMADCRRARNGTFPLLSISPDHRDSYWDGAAFFYSGVTIYLLDHKPKKEAGCKATHSQKHTLYDLHLYIKVKQK